MARLDEHLCHKNVVMHRGTPTYFPTLSASLIITFIITIISRVGGEYVMPVPGALCAMSSLVAYAQNLLTDLLNFPIVVQNLAGDTMWGQVKMLWGQNVDVSKLVETVEKDVGDALVCELNDIAHLLLGYPGLLS